MKRLVMMLALVLVGLFAETSAHAAVRNIFYAGTCSYGWSDAAQNSGYQTVDEFGFWSGEETWDAYVDERTSTSGAVAGLKSTLDQLCTGSNSCYVFTYSQGGAILSKLFSDYSTNWNIVWAAVAANNFANVTITVPGGFTAGTDYSLTIEEGAADLFGVPLPASGVTTITWTTVP